MANILPTSEDIEGIDTPSSVMGWDDYPLDAVFVRNENRTVGEVIRRVRAGRYQLDPDFQRDFVWTVAQQSRLIESCLMRIPLPVLYVAEMRNGMIAVVDGLQRITTFRRYLDNEFSLAFHETGEKTFNPIDGKRFSDLPINLQERIEDTQLTLYILDAAAPERAKLDIFERVNSGVPLTRQQMRNCLYSGPATQWLSGASNNQHFLAATGNSLDRKSMRDREAINRFCAFTLRTEAGYRGDMDAFLAEALDIMQRDDARQYLDQRFQYAMYLNSQIFGQHAFRKSLGPYVYGRDGPRSVLNISLFDVLSVCLSEIPWEWAYHNVRKIQTAVAELLESYDFNFAISYSTNSNRQVLTRFRMTRDMVKRIQNDH